MTPYSAPATASQVTVTIGLGPKGGGWFERFLVDITSPTSNGFFVGSNAEWGHVSTDDYPALPDASTCVSTGDVYGDGLQEVLVGTGVGGKGKVYVFRNYQSGYELSATLQVSGWPSYVNSSDSSTYPACVDLDGDGQAEIVIGTGTKGTGWCQIWKWDQKTCTFKTFAGTPRPDGYLQVSWPAYCASSSGEVHPSGGYLRGRGAGKGQQLVLGLGAAGQGWMQIWTWNGIGLVPYAMPSNANGWLQVQWAAYNSSGDGSTWPACGDIDGDGYDDLVVGLGNTGLAWLEVFRSSGGDLAHSDWRQVQWASYATSGRAAVHPAVGDIDGDGRGDLIVGLSEKGGGWIYVLRSGTGSWTESWSRVLWSTYNAGDSAPTFPAVSRYQPDPPTPPVTTSAYVQAAQGADIAVGTVTVSVPAGSLSDDSTVTATVYAHPPENLVPPGGATPVGKSLFISAPNASINGGLTVNLPVPAGTSPNVAMATRPDGTSLVVDSWTNPLAAPTAATGIRSYAEAFPNRIVAVPSGLLTGYATGTSGGTTICLYDILRKPNPNAANFQPSGATPENDANWRQAQRGQRFAVFIHGINSNAGKMNDVLKAVKAFRTRTSALVYRGVATLEYDYTAGPSTASHLLLQELNARNFLTSGAQIDIYGHSFGGIVARYFIQRDLPASQAGAVCRLFTIGTPHEGTQAMVNPDPIVIRCLNAASIFAGDGPVWPNTSETMRWMTPGSEEIKGLNDTLSSPLSQVEVFTVAGNKFPAWINQDELQGDLLGAIYFELSQLLWLEDPLRDRNDGAVPRHSAFGGSDGALFRGTRNYSAAHRFEVPLHHSELVAKETDGEVIEQLLKWVQDSIGDTTPTPSPSPSPSPGAAFLQWPGQADSPEALEFNARPSAMGELFWIDFYVKNTGNTTWKASDGYALWNNAAQRGLANIPDHISIDRDVPPGTVWTYRMNLRAPLLAGSSFLTARMARSADQIGNYINWNITVSDSASDAAAFLEWPGQPDSAAAAEFKSRPSTPGESFWIDYYAKNTGNTIWRSSDGYNLWNNARERGLADISDHIPLDRDIAPGQVWNYRMYLRAPLTTGSPRLTARMGRNLDTFGSYINWDVPVSATDSAVFLEWPGAADSTQAPEFKARPSAGAESFWIDFYVKNVGNTTWRASDGYNLWNNARERGLADISDHIQLDRDVAPGEVWNYRMTLRAPATTGTSRLTARLGRNLDTFGNYINWDIVVTTAADQAVFLEWPGNSNSTKAPEFNTRAKSAFEEFWIDFYIKNTGTTTWRASDGYNLWNNARERALADISDHIALDRDIPPGDVWNYRMYLRAPLSAGTSRLTARLGRNLDTFGDYINWDVVVGVSAPSATGSIMNAGQQLAPNQRIESPSGRFTFVFWPGGTVALYDNSPAWHVIWNNNQSASGSVTCVMQPDGNLVTYSGAHAFWSTGTSLNPGSWLTVQDDGNVVIYRPGGVPIWATNTVIH